jgi:hypothetical protein
MINKETSSRDKDDLFQREEEMLWKSRKIAEAIIESVPT